MGLRRGKALWEAFLSVLNMCCHICPCSSPKTDTVSHFARDKETELIFP